jgi:hypothetical protein
MARDKEKPLPQYLRQGLDDLAEKFQVGIAPGPASLRHATTKGSRFRQQLNHQLCRSASA